VAVDPETGSIDPSDQRRQSGSLYDAAVWRVGRSRREMNFPETESLTKAEFHTPQPALVTEEDRRRHRAV
jgi:hypothetical protein